MSAFTNIMLVLALLTFTSLIIFLIVSLVKDRKDPTNKPYIVNYCNYYTEGYGLLLEADKKSRGDFWEIKGLPRDPNYIKLNNDNKTKLKPVTLYVRKDLYKLFMITEREFFRALPEDKADLPINTMSEDEYKYRCEEIDKANAIRDGSYVENTAKENLFKMKLKTEGLEQLNEIVGLNKDYLKSIGSREVQPNQDKQS